MLNFGVQEIANSKSISAPGWAYVPDTGINASVAALQPSSRKRPRTQLGPSNNNHDTTAKQDAKLLRELALLDRENHKDVLIPVPVRHRDNAGRVSHGKVTPAVRKILQSAKTFANHLSDYEAYLTTAVSNPVPVRPPPPVATPSTPIVRAAPGTSIPHLTSKGTRSHKKKPPPGSVVATPTPLRQVSTPSASTVATPAPKSIDTPMLDAPMLELASCPIPPANPGDEDPLLVSRIPALPSKEEIAKLLAMPPLSYLEAKGPWVEEERRKPVRRFCEVCGYWGRVRCRTCGGRVCALECLGVHREECYAKYGA